MAPGSDNPPVWWPQTRRAAGLAILCLALAVALVAGLASFVIADGRSADRANRDKAVQVSIEQAVKDNSAIAVRNRALIHRQRASEMRACEDLKGDRKDTARALTAQANYLDKVLAAASVKEDVKRAARAAQTLMAESANQLRSRLYECAPYVNDGKHILDKAALQEAQGIL